VHGTIGVMTAPVVLLEVSERIATVTLNRPEARNALSAEVLRLLSQHLKEADGRDDVDVIILTGADPAFCAGLDLRELGDGARQRDRSDGADGSANADGVRGPFPPLDKPLIGAINGVAITGGLELAINCDFLVASERARFADTHARVGIMPGWGLTVLQVEAVGVRRARELSATGNFLDAPTALAWGLVNHVVAHDELLPFTRELALAAVHNDQAGVRRMLGTYAEIADDVYDGPWAIEDRVNRAWLAGGLDHAEIASRRQGVVDRGRTQL
jgi:enoyl-CoA hydratase